MSYKLKPFCLKKNYYLIVICTGHITINSLEFKDIYLHCNI